MSNDFYLGLIIGGVCGAVIGVLTVAVMWTMDRRCER